MAEVPASIDAQDFSAFKEAVTALGEGKLGDDGKVVKAATTPAQIDDTTPAVDDAPVVVEDTPEQKAAKEIAAKKVAEQKPRKTVQQRIDEFRRQSSEAQEVAQIEAGESERHRLRAEKLEAELADLRAGKKPVVEAGMTGAPLLVNGEPNPDAYTYGVIDPAYHKAAIAHGVKMEVEATMKTVREAAAGDSEKAENLRKFNDVLAKGLEKHDDYLQVVVQGAEKGAYKLSPLGAQILVDSELGHEVAYHLAKNPAEAAEIFEMQPHRQAAAFGRLEAKIAAQLETAAADTSQNEEEVDGEDDETPSAHTPAVTPSKSVSQAPAPPRKTERSAGGEFAIAADTKDFNKYKQAVAKLQQRK